MSAILEYALSLCTTEVYLDTLIHLKMEEINDSNHATFGANMLVASSYALYAKAVPEMDDIIKKDLYTEPSETMFFTDAMIIGSDTENVIDNALAELKVKVDKTEIRLLYFALSKEEKSNIMDISTQFTVFFLTTSQFQYISIQVTCSILSGVHLIFNISAMLQKIHPRILYS